MAELMPLFEEIRQNEYKDNAPLATIMVGHSSESCLFTNFNAVMA